MNDKRIFLDVVEQTVAKHPDWFADVILAMQNGLVMRIDTEQTEKANLAYAMAFFIKHAPKVAQKGGPLPSAYKTLLKFFDGAPISRDIEQLLKNANGVDSFLICPGCGDDRSEKGSLFAPSGDDMQVFCNESCYYKWQAGMVTK